jgi:dTDP-D-glucose 4,6-dehydratase
VFVQADIRDHSMVHTVLRDHRIEGVINGAAETHVDRSILDPGSCARTDVVGTGVPPGFLGIRQCYEEQYGQRLKEGNAVEGISDKGTMTK